MIDAARRAIGNAAIDGDLLTAADILTDLDDVFAIGHCPHDFDAAVINALGALHHHHGVGAAGRKLETG